MLPKWLSFAVFEDNVVPCVPWLECVDGAAEVSRQQLAGCSALVWVSLHLRAHLGPTEASTASNLDSCCKEARVLHVLWPREALRVVCGLWVLS